jgi:hypothetical protein
MSDEEIDDVRQEVWSAMLTAEYNARYWDYLYKRYYRRQKRAEIFLAATSSASVAAWGIWSSITILWKLLSGLSTLVAVTLPILNMKKQITDLGDLQSRWQQIHAEYELLWFDIEHTSAIGKSQVIADFKELKRKEAEIAKIPSDVPDDIKLLEETRQQVISAHAEQTE